MCARHLVQVGHPPDLPERRIYSYICTYIYIYITGHTHTHTRTTSAIARSQCSRLLYSKRAASYVNAPSSPLSFIYTNTRQEQHNTTHDKNNTTNDHTKNHPPHVTTIEGGATTVRTTSQNTVQII